MRKLGVLLLLMLLASPAYSQTLEQQEKLNQLEKALGTIDELEKSIERFSRQRLAQCITAVASKPFCDCLGQHLPVVVNFVGYVTIVTQTKEELKYDRLSAEDKRVVDNTRLARDRCVKTR
jgi:hypothetical protein